MVDIGLWQVRGMLLGHTRPRAPAWALGGGFSSLMSNDGNFWGNVGSSALWGAGTGFAVGSYYGYGQAKAMDVNPWTGMPNIHYLAPLEGVALRRYDLSGRHIFEVKKVNINWNDRVINASDRFHKLDNSMIPDKLYMQPKINGDGKGMHLIWKGSEIKLPSSKSGYYYGHYEIIYNGTVESVYYGGNGWNHFYFKSIYKR